MNLFTFDKVNFIRSQEHNVLNEISFTIKSNKRTAIVGENGAGKSTVLFHLNGLFKATKGTILFKDQEMNKSLRKEMVKHVGIVFQDPDDQIISLTVEEEVAFAPLQMGQPLDEVKRRVKKYLQLLNIEHLAKRNPSELSYGQKKYVSIAGVLAMETEVFILDEPMAFLDPMGKDHMISIMKLLEEEGKTVIVTTHDMQFVAEWAEEVVVIHDGKSLGVFTPEELFRSEDVLKKARLTLPPSVQIVNSIWNDEWGKVPIKIDDIRDWLKGKLESTNLEHLIK